MFKQNIHICNGKNYIYLLLLSNKHYKKLFEDCLILSLIVIYIFSSLLLFEFVVNYLPTLYLVLSNTKMLSIDLILKSRQLQL